MATNSSDVVITNFMANGYNGDVTATKSGFAIAGRIVCNSNKDITSFNGDVRTNDALVCTFNSMSTPGQGGVPVLTYNLSNIKDVAIASQALIAIGAAETDIQNEINKENE